MAPFQTAYPMIVLLIFLLLAGNAAYVSFVFVKYSMLIRLRSLSCECRDTSHPAQLNLFNTKPSLCDVSITQVPNQMTF